jgi:hypothetical protein
MAAAGVLLQEAGGGGHQVLHLRQRAAGRLQRGQTLQVFAGGTTIPPTHRPQAARHVPVPHNAAMVGPPTAAALLHRQIHIRHPTHTGPGERGSGRLEPPTSCGCTAAAAESTSLSHSRRRGLAGGGASVSGATHPGCHRRCAAGRLFGDGRRPTVLPGGGGDDELPHIADHNPGSRRHHATRGRLDRGVPPAGTAPTQGGGFPVAALYTPPGVAGDPPPHHSSLLLATDGQGHYPDGQGLPAVPARQNSQTHTPTTDRDICTSPPFRPPPRGPGRAAAAFARPHLPVHHHRQDVEVAGGHPAHLHHRRRLRQSPLRRVGVPFRSTSHHHFR